MSEVAVERPFIKGRQVAIPPGINGSSGDGRIVPTGKGTFSVGGDIAYFRLWKRVRRHSTKGVDCGDFFTVKDLPVSTRHNSSDGVGISDQGHTVFTARHWTEKGWRHLDELPSGWEEVNAATTAKQRELDQEFSEVGQMVKTNEQLALLVSQLLEERRNGGNAADRGSAPPPAGIAGAEGGGGGAPPAGRRGR